ALLAARSAAMSIASASAAPKSAANQSVQVLHLISHQMSLQVIDIGKKGPSPGDQVIETTVDFQHGTRVDRSVLNCVDITVSKRGFDVLCHGALIFENGQVQFQGETNFHTPFTASCLGAGPGMAVVWKAMVPPGSRNMPLQSARRASGGTETITQDSASSPTCRRWEKSWSFATISSPSANGDFGLRTLFAWM